jgi:peptide methionine sulfoxide reductase msrA/msrB
MTSENTRHCVNSVSLDFTSVPREEAFFAGGCFWGVEALLEELPGVVDAESGYMGGSREAPGYRDVINGGTGHAETVRVVFDPSKVGYEAVAKHFFEIHDPTQINRQGPDRGEQYRSAVFTVGDAQAKVIHGLIGRLQEKGLRVATQVRPAGVFWPAEDYHQDYYRRTGKAPYCHSHTPRF